uniref:Uncharacterized protein n=1 Tax=Tanacetum cinerariifolium TaxID=118510 RepID=A0A6L2M1M3_TANCI|nr:hypothetical protein [Tanacetum cinerariifolium]
MQSSSVVNEVPSQITNILSQCGDTSQVRIQEQGQGSSVINELPSQATKFDELKIMMPCAVDSRAGPNGVQNGKDEVETKVRVVEESDEAVEVAKEDDVAVEVAHDENDGSSSYKSNGSR